MIGTDIKCPNVLEGCSSKKEWQEKRKEILLKFAEIEYGKRPDMEYKVSWEECVREEVSELQAVHITTNLAIETELGKYTFPVTVFVPLCEEKVPASILICSQSKNPVPMKLPAGMEGKSMQELFAMFEGMMKQFQIIMKEPAQMAGMMAGGTPKALNLDTDYDNGHWPVREMMKRKMALVGFYANDAEKDDAETFPCGLAKLFGTEHERREQEWGILAVWAFAAQCVMDYVETIPEIDAAQVAVTGHSRCGKAALWCGANDERFMAVMPNGSGCCGAALSRGKTGENLASIQAFFPHWFAPGFRQYAGREEELPFDQHFLLAAVAPRILHVGSGSEDAWADPEGEHYSTVLASKVWNLYDTCELGDSMPEENEKEISGPVGYHLRKGPHLLDTFDWICLAEHMSE